MTIGKEEPTKKITQTRGWGEWCGAWRSIDNNCPYGCYFCFGRVKAIQYKRITDKDHWLIPVPHVSKPSIPKDTVVGFPATHDIHEKNYDRCAEFILKLLENNNKLLLVSKPNYKVTNLLINLLEPWQDKVEFRFTINWYEPELQMYEPFAPGFKERVKSLQAVFLAGFYTSISIEPYLTRNVTGLIDRLYSWVRGDFWVGIMNHFSKIVKLYPEVENLRWLYSRDTVQALLEE